MLEYNHSQVSLESKILALASTQRALASTQRALSSMVLASVKLHLSCTVCETQFISSYVPLRNHHMQTNKTDIKCIMGALYIGVFLFGLAC